MPHIKFCGLKTLEDISLAAELCAKAIGFVLTRSPRQVDPALCRRLRDAVPAGIRVHGVFAGEDAATIRKLVLECRLDVAQVHGAEDDAAYWRSLSGLPVIRAFRVQGPETLQLLGAVRGQEFLLDAYVPGKAGGTGDRFDWSLARQAATYGRVILAGGLTPAD